LGDGSRLRLLGQRLGSLGLGLGTRVAPVGP